MTMHPFRFRDTPALVARNWPLALTWALLSAYALVHGPTLSPDSMTYSHWADLLLEERFDFATYLPRTDFTGFPVLYTTFVIIVAVAKVLFGGDWPYAIVSINCLALGGTLMCLAGIVRDIGFSVMASRIVTLGFLVSVDLAIWVHYVLTDYIFLFLVTAGMWSLARYMITAQSRYAWILLLISGTMLFSRPTALPFVASFLVGFLYFRIARYGMRVVGNALFSITLLLAALIGIYIYLLGLVSSGAIHSGQLVYLASFVMDGVVVIDRPETFIRMAADPAHYLWLIACRTVAFFRIYYASYSWTHIALNTIFYVPLYAAATVAAINVVWQRGEKTWRLFGLFLLTLLAMVTLYHAMTIIDYDHRYRLPVLPALMLLAISLLPGRHIPCLAEDVGEATRPAISAHPQGTTHS